MRKNVAGRAFRRKERSGWEAKRDAGDCGRVRSEARKRGTESSDEHTPSSIEPRNERELPPYEMADGGLGADAAEDGRQIRDGPHLRLFVALLDGNDAAAIGKFFTEHDGETFADPHMAEPLADDKGERTVERF